MAALRCRRRRTSVLGGRQPRVAPAPRRISGCVLRFRVIPQMRCWDAARRRARQRLPVDLVEVERRHGRRGLDHVRVGCHRRIEQPLDSRQHVGHVHAGVERDELLREVDEHRAQRAELVGQRVRQDRLTQPIHQPHVSGEGPRRLVVNQDPLDSGVARGDEVGERSPEPDDQLGLVPARRRSRNRRRGQVPPRGSGWRGRSSA